MAKPIVFTLLCERVKCVQQYGIYVIMNSNKLDYVIGIVVGVFTHFGIKNNATPINKLTLINEPTMYF